MWVAQIDLISVWGIELDLIPVWDEINLVVGVGLSLIHI